MTGNDINEMHFSYDEGNDSWRVKDCNRIFPSHVLLQPYIEE
jgi:hypothetical protein